ncbi:MAG TPA: hypothetical protein DEA96_00040 [Leptospiraceae bacterium]|nr:hypothetical protein [Spirochaetaceae bacterium]HBS03322.1 hypothetical protein [Leptospiraceae bacterium]|tara:strand:+ start:20820 stop:21140 length:321 start_codon:yes stop_codon:yes gene_type:complete
MKRTELERRQRELRRAEKKVEVLERKAGEEKKNAGFYINHLASLFRHDMNEIFNTKDDLDILESLEGLKEDLPEKQWETVLRKAVNRTKVTEVDRAVNELREMMGA